VIKITSYFESISIKSGLRTEFHKITDKVKSVLSKSKIKNGIATIYSPHTTCPLLIQEDSLDADPEGTRFLFQDLLDVFEKIIPRCYRIGQYIHPGPKMIKYAEDLGDQLGYVLNTHAHLRSSLMCHSQTIPVVDGKLQLGIHQDLWFIDLDDTRERERKIHVQVIGE